MVGPIVVLSALGGAALAEHYGRTSPCTVHPKWDRQDALLADLHPVLYSQVQWLFAKLREEGWHPILSSGWRSKAEQDILRARGSTGAVWSRHMGISPMGFPWGMAVDIVDCRYGRPSEHGETARQAAKFFRALGKWAEKLGLVWGGRFSEKNAPSSYERGFWPTYDIDGWDPIHLELPETSSKKIKAQYRAHERRVASGEMESPVPRVPTSPVVVATSTPAATGAWSGASGLSLLAKNTGVEYGPGAVPPGTYDIVWTHPTGQQFTITSVPVTVSVGGRYEAPLYSGKVRWLTQ